MPIYEFACQSCRHRFDVFGSYASRDAAQVCPACESTRTRVLFSAVAVSGGAREATSIPAERSQGGGCGGCGGGCACGN